MASTPMRREKTLVTHAVVGCSAPHGSRNCCGEGQGVSSLWGYNRTKDDRSDFTQPRPLKGDESPFHQIHCQCEEFRKVNPHIIFQF